MSERVADRVLAALAAVKHVPRESISLDSALADLRVDSLDTITLLFELEEHFHLTLPDDVVRSLRTVRQIVEAIERSLAAPSPGPAPAATSD
ncbi:MAG TPA: phosphopantetheine-binding protein [Candidatus Acidoferrales bacterium]|nr:phosphopantetheine-binding protein [Candidatus Acidoferrales bacterium]